MRYAFLICAALITAAFPVQALEVAGIMVPEDIRLHSDGAALTLNGAGIRRRFFVNVYVGALYLPRRADSLAAIETMPGAKRMAMHFVHSEVGADKLVQAWTEGFERNSTPEEFRALRARIANFNGLFPTLRKGDRVDVDFPAAGGVEVWINGTRRGRVQGEDFARALLRVWLGKHPADEGLKKGLLGRR